MSVIKKNRSPPTRSATTRPDLREEREIAAAYRRGEFVSQGTATPSGQLQAAARATPLKDQRINIRLSSDDLRGLQARAQEEGLPYQTLISSVLHKFVTGRLVDLPRTLPGALRRAGQRRTTPARR